MHRATASVGWPTATIVMASSAPSLELAALAYAQAGVPVFPCLPEGKAPLTQRGFHDASRDSRQVGVWWRHWPEANIGLSTGAASGIDVVDIDMHDGEGGFAGFERARQAGLVASWAWLVRTPSGGVHAYYPHGPEQRSWALGTAHVDFRGDGGYVIAPPSRLRTASGVVREYELMVIAQRVPAPVDATALRKLLAPPQRAHALKAVPVAGTAPERLAEWVATRPQGGRNGALFWAACRMVEDGFDHASVLGLLGEAARCAGLGEREVAATIRSAFRRTSREDLGGSRRPGHAQAMSRSSREAMSR
ncbi:bifunctional DNA primase/polymerase [Georgenia sp. H159]|uniref:bifunctional DNA primase/polymerase n=1 Tax=Georgenia sp. H159 TaxID=3076115 RepID=UPI002D76C894|nr:bifunctional DNA primase/polymerase [Georgenia sp. H159]